MAAHEGITQFKDFEEIEQAGIKNISDWLNRSNVLKAVIDGAAETAAVHVHKPSASSEVLEV